LRQAVQYGSSSIDGPSLLAGRAALTDIRSGRPWWTADYLKNGTWNVAQVRRSRLPDRDDRLWKTHKSKRFQVIGDGVSQPPAAFAGQVSKSLKKNATGC
jgi:hypothetical protein